MKLWTEMFVTNKFMCLLVYVKKCLFGFDVYVCMVEV